eukprot:8205606-Pyramimonas_sp.AAC.1
MGPQTLISSKCELCLLSKRKEATEFPRQGISCIFQTSRSEPQWIDYASQRVTILSHVFHDLATRESEKQTSAQKRTREPERARERVQTLRWNGHQTLVLYGGRQFSRSAQVSSIYT